MQFFARLTQMSFGGAFLLGILLAFVIGALAGARFGLPVIARILPGQNIAAVGSTATIPTPEKTDTDAHAATLPFSTNGNTLAFADTADTADVAFDSIPPEQSIDQQLNVLNTIIDDHEVQITQLNIELERIKDQSVSLVADFDRNCGSWKDDCAIPYANALDTRNTRYSQIATKLGVLNQELKAAQNDRADLSASL